MSHYNSIIKLYIPELNSFFTEKTAICPEIVFPHIIINGNNVIDLLKKGHDKSPSKGVRYRLWKP